MKKLLFRSLMLSCAYMMLIFLNGCWICKCGDVPPYLDFQDAFLMQDLTLEVAPDQVAIRLEGTDIEYLAQQNCGGGFGALCACKCEPNGFLGLKFEIDQLDVYSLDDYSTSLTAGTSLNSMFNYRPDGSPTGELNTTAPDIYSFPAFYLYSQTPPQDTTQPQHIWVELSKSNGDFVTTDTVEVFW